MTKIEDIQIGQKLIILKDINFASEFKADVADGLIITKKDKDFLWLKREDGTPTKLDNNREWSLSFKSYLDACDVVSIVYEFKSRLELIDL